ncbi:uncharacterized protein CG3556 [Leptinotarsa decemlineata]|uniref:uncharacterized protein CG3556 n=1 Tax=Leptinotarsa decemlineata TaxID=7539 RepID=UPI003D307EA7
MYLLSLILFNLIIFSAGTKFHATSNEGDSRYSDITISYTVWVGPDITESATINITAPKRTPFYEVMQLAMKKDPYFTFEATESTFGHYITTIAGHKEDKAKNIFWFIYNLKEMPDPNSPPSDDLLSPVGVDGLMIEKGYHYLFWYRIWKS